MRRLELPGLPPTSSPGPRKSRCITSWPALTMAVFAHYVIADEVGGAAQDVPTGGRGETEIREDCQSSRHQNNPAGSCLKGEPPCDYIIITSQCTLQTMLGVVL